jgi:hypothetical protein
MGPSLHGLLLTLPSEHILILLAYVPVQNPCFRCPCAGETYLISHDFDVWWLFSFDCILSVRS